MKTTGETLVNSINQVTSLIKSEPLTLDRCISLYEKEEVSITTKNKLICHINHLIKESYINGGLSDKELVILNYLTGIYIYVCEVLDENSSYT